MSDDLQMGGLGDGDDEDNEDGDNNNNGEHNGHNNDEDGDDENEPVSKLRLRCSAHARHATACWRTLVGGGLCRGSALHAVGA